MRKMAFLLVAIFAIVIPSTAARAKTTSPTFTNFQLGAASVGQTCPSKTPRCVNGAAEPAIRANLAGEFYGSSENGLSAGTEAWRSTTGGLSYTHLLSPNQVSTVAPGAPNNISPAGGDTDLAVASAKNTKGNYNVYVSSLELANVAVSTSQDKGASWSINPKAATISGDDREWIAAEGASKVCISYRDLAAIGIHVDCSLDAGTTFLQEGEAQDTNHVYTRTNFEIGNLAIDPKNHYVYQTFSSIDSGDTVNCQNPTSTQCNFHVVYMAVSTDGGKTFTDYPVYDNPNRSVSYGHQFVNVSVDKAGNVYSVYCDNHNIYYSVSTNHGKTWSAPSRVNSFAANTAIFPWSTVLAPGKIDIVYYGTAFYDGKTAPDAYPVTAKWYVYFAQDLAATTNHNFTQTQATPQYIHSGGVCEGGVTCTGNSSANRDLFDDFGVAANPLTGKASIIYSDDQNDPSQPQQCTEAQDNTAQCNHTNIATQLGGPVIK
ncbi:MAG: hypothetical protein ACR2JC_19535 [Chloroflexota bacterium]